EPTDLNIVHAHKGIARWHVTTPGRSCHSSSPEKGINAIYRMGRLIVAIEEYAAKLCASKGDPVLGPTTLIVGRIEGGSSVSVIPDHCRIDVDRRVIPGEDPLATPGQLAAFLKDHPGIDFPFECSEPWMHKESLSPEGSEDLVARLGQAIDSVKGSHQVLAVP